MSDSDTKRSEALHLCTHLLFVDMFYANTIDTLNYEAMKEAEELGIYKYDIKKNINAIKDRWRKQMIIFRDCERVRVMPILSYALQSHSDSYHDFGKMTQRVQYGLYEMTKKHRFILENCIDNWVKNIKAFPAKQNKFWTKVMAMDCILCGATSFSDAIQEVLIQKLGPHVTLDENLLAIRMNFVGMKKETESLYLKKVKSADDTKDCDYWKKQSETALSNLNLRLEDADCQSLLNGQLFETIKDYSMWWFARIVKDIREKGRIPDEVDADLRRVLKGSPLVLGRIHRTLLSLAKKCKEEDILDLQDEIFEQHLTKDIITFIEKSCLCLIAEDEQEKVKEVLRKSQAKKVLTL